MCRLYGQISHRAEHAAEGLADDPHSLLRLSNRDPKRRQPDGWGVGWYAVNGPRIIKSAGAAYSEERPFRRAAEHAHSRIIVGHIRRLSNPRGLARRRLLSRANSQPYLYRKILFAHNGEVMIPTEVARHLGKYRTYVKGLNDSEIFFWQFMKFYDALGDIPRALVACVHETRRIWRSCRKRYPKLKTGYKGFNTLVSDGKSLHAMCHFPALPGAKGIANRRQAWGRMSFSLDRGRARIASEDLSRGRWSRLGGAELLSITPARRGFKTTRRRFDPGG